MFNQISDLVNQWLGLPMSNYVGAPQKPNCWRKGLFTYPFDWRESSISTTELVNSFVRSLAWLLANSMFVTHRSSLWRASSTYLIWSENLTRPSSSRKTKQLSVTGIAYWSLDRSFADGQLHYTNQQ